jgi:hypothetical protein
MSRIALVGSTRNKAWQAATAINVQIRSGTNQLHGSAHEFHNQPELHSWAGVLPIWIPAFSITSESMRFSFQLKAEAFGLTNTPRFLEGVVSCVAIRGTRGAKRAISVGTRLRALSPARSVDGPRHELGRRFFGNFGVRVREPPDGKAFTRPAATRKTEGVFLAY